jgi:hypothetical protein
MDDYAWIRNWDAPMGPAHPDYETLLELDDVERWIEAGAPAPDSRPPEPMPSAPSSVAVPTVALAVSREQAASLIGVSVDTFERRVLPALRVVQVGRRQLVPVRELERWVEDNSARALR